MTASIWASVDIGSEQATTYHFLYVNAEMSEIPLIPLPADHFAGIAQDFRSLCGLPFQNESRFAVELASIPEPHRADFEQFLRGRQMPVVEGHGPCAYLMDFREWVLAQQIAGRL